MIHIYKAGGGWKTKDGRKFTVKSVSSKDAKNYVDEGWVMSVDDIKKPKAKPRKKVATDDNL